MTRKPHELDAGGNCPDCATLAKPHLRLHYNPTPGPLPVPAHWSIELVRNSRWSDARRKTFWHDTSGAAIRTAAMLWF